MTTTKPRKVRTMFDGNPHCDGVPFGRMLDVLATVADHETLAWHNRKGGIGAGGDLFRYPSRAALLDAIRAERSGPGPYRIVAVDKAETATLY